MTRWMIVDVSNILFRVWAAQGRVEDTAEHLGLCMHSSFLTIKKWFKKVNPDQLVFAFEGGNNWRKEYMARADAVSKLGYKVNRVYDPSMQQLFSLIDDFKTLMIEHSAIPCLAVDGCEGDDVIAAFVQLYSSPSDHITILSGDRDFIQLLKHPNVTLLDPATGLDRAVDKKTGKPIDPELYIFEKCIRGDRSDGVASAYPRIRKTLIEKAFVDEATRINLMNEVITGPDGTYRVGDKFEENRVLMDLEAQPEEIKARLYEAVSREISSPGSYSNFHFMRFLGKYKLQAIADSFASFSDMFSRATPRGASNPLLEE